MNISLVFPPFYLESMYNLPPLGLINLATGIKNPGRRVVIHDFVLALRQKTISMSSAIYDDCAQIIIADDPDVVGFSAQCTTYPAVIQIARRVKEKKKRIKILIGGHNASFVDQQTLFCFPWINAIIRGEGEITFKELVNAYEEGRDETGILGLTYCTGKNIVTNDDRRLIDNLDDLPFADYSFVPPLAEYRDACELPRSIAIIEVGRGCPHRCIYCSESIMWQRKTRIFSAGRLVDEMRHLHKNHGAQCFLLSFDQFTANRKFVESFCRLIIEKELNNLPWYCISRLDTVDASLLRMMCDAGCESMCYGIDSGSKKTLAFIRKQIDEDILYRRVMETTEQGIVPTLSFVIGFPEEEKVDIDATLTLALKTGIQGNSNPLIQMPTVLPGTDLFKEYHKKLVREVDTYFSMGLEFDNGKRLLSDDGLIDNHPFIFSSFYNIPCRGLALDSLKIIAGFFPLIIKLYPKAFLLLSLALKQSVSDLFINWLNRLKKQTGRDSIFLTAQDCYQHFPLFAGQLLEQAKISGFKHLKEIINYETCALEAGKFNNRSSVGNIDLCRLAKWRPKRCQNLLVANFSHNLPVIIADLKNGNYQNEYPSESVCLVFTHSRNELEVTEINDFGKDFLDLCDGSLTVEKIGARLYPQYGENMDSKVFLEACREAVVGLSELRFISAATPKIKD